MSSHLKNINSIAENKQLLDQNQVNGNNNHSTDDVDISLNKLRLSSQHYNGAYGGSDSNVHKSDYKTCDTRCNESLLNRSATDSAMAESNSDKHDIKSTYKKTHCRNSSYDGLLMHSRHNSESCSSVGSTSSSHSRHNSGDSSSFFSKNVFEWKSNSVSSDLDASNAPGGPGPKPSGGLFKWNLFSRGFEPPCGESDGISVHSNASTLSNHSRENSYSTLARDAGNYSHETVTVSSTALIPHDRPKELPAKSEEERQKHEREYQKMLENIKKKEEQEGKLRRKQLEEQLKLEEQQASAVKIWTQEILPHWASMRGTRKARDLWWRGVPPCVRSKVWALAIGNELGITRQMFDQCMKDAEARSQDIYDNTLTQIRLDISRTFPALCLFQTRGPYHTPLHLTLAAYVSYNTQVSYVQGMSYICALLLLNLASPQETFTCFANLLNSPLFSVFYTLNIRMMQAYYATYNDLLKYNLPKLFRHFANTGLTPDLYLLDWIYTLYSKAMGLDLVCRIWDLVMRDGEVFVFRAALGILHLHEDTLLGMDFLQGSKFLTKLPDNLNPDLLFKSIGQMSTSIYRKPFDLILTHHKSYV